MAWVLLIVAGIFEIGWAVGLKYTAGFTRLWPTAATIAGMAVSIGLLGMAVPPCPTCGAVIHKLGGTAAGCPASLVSLWREQHPEIPLQLQLAIERSCRQEKVPLEYGMVVDPQAPRWEGLRKLVIDSVSPVHSRRRVRVHFE